MKKTLLHFLNFSLAIFISLLFLNCPTTQRSLPAQGTNEESETQGSVYTKINVYDADIDSIELTSLSLDLSVDIIDLDSAISYIGTGDYVAIDLAKKHFTVTYSANRKDKDGTIVATIADQAVSIGNINDLTAYDLENFDYYWDIVLFNNVTEAGTVYIDAFSDLTITPRTKTAKNRATVTAPADLNDEYIKITNTITSSKITFNYINVNGALFTATFVDGSTDYVTLTDNNGTTPSVTYSVSIINYANTMLAMITGSIGAVIIGNPETEEPTDIKYDYYWDVLLTTGYNFKTEKATIRKFVTLNKIAVE